MVLLSTTTCRKVLILWSAVFSLNVAEPSRSESEYQANLAVDTIENVIRSGVEKKKILLKAGKGPESKTNLIDGLLIN